jgi:hypothetical protein
MSSIAFDGTKVVLKQERWHHIVLRHPELKNAAELILDVVAHPDEVYVDPTGAFHALKRVSDISDFLVVIYSVNDEGYIRTAYFTSTIRKTRRYKTFRKLKPS